jgi:hypothetical protein
MTGLFARWQPLYAEHGIPTFPVRDKRPAVRGYLKLGSITSTRLAEKFPDANAIGFALGERSKITVLDVDTPDERVLADALDRHGPTPIVIRSGSGNHQGWYRWNGERRQIRPFGEKPIDVLGGGFVVAPPSHGSKLNYRFIEGTLDDIDHLPYLRGIPPNIEGQTGAATQETEYVGEGARNNTLFRHCMRAAHHCDDFDALIDVARTRNDEFLPPLPDSEVVKVAKSAWDYSERGANRFGRRGVFFDADEANRLITSDSDVFVLLAFLRANNRPQSIFMVANGLAGFLGWGLNRFRRARNRLVETEIEMVRRPSTSKGPALYRWKYKGGRI